MKKTCPICSKTISYRGGVFNKHGYQIKEHQHTPSLCFASYKPEEGLLEKYVDFLKASIETESKNFPEEWLENYNSIPYDVIKSRRGEYKSFVATKQMKADLRLFSQKLKEKEV